MINVKEIKLSKLYKIPWEHLIVDNFLDDDVFKQITEELQITQKTLINQKRNTDGWWPFHLENMGVSKKTTDLIMEINREILDNTYIIEKFSDASKSTIGYYSIPRFNFTHPFIKEEIHDDSGDKTVVILLYLAPENSIGTNLYTKNTLSSLSKTIEWKPNRAVFFAPKKNVTWHDFESNNLPRYTINFYFEKLEQLDIITSINRTTSENCISRTEKTCWFYNELSKKENNISIELKQ